MTRLPDERIIHLLRTRLPVQRDTPAADDVWLRMESRLHEGRAHDRATLDWMLAAAVVALCALYPSTFAMVLLHF